MLAHLVFIRQISDTTTTKRALWLRGILVGSLALAAATQEAKGADTLPLGVLDAGSAAKVSSADVAVPGSMRVGIAVESVRGAVSHETIHQRTFDQAADANKAILQDAHRVSALIGTTLTSYLELNLGLHGSYEHVSPSARDGLYGSDGAKDPEWRENVKQTGFAGASLFLKFKLAQWRGLRLALAPFAESGAGEQATYALTRSVGPKAGFVAIASYGAPGVADLSLNAGYRYRDPEALGEVSLRHEQFYKVLVRAYARHDLSFFLAAEGRRLMMAHRDAADLESTDLSYEAKPSNELRGGAEVSLGRYDLSAFAGSRVGEGAALGFGRMSFGMAVAMHLGEGAARRGVRTSFAADIEAEQQTVAASQDAGVKEKGAEDKDAKASKDDYEEMIGADIDPLEVLANDDAPDFKDVETRERQYAKEATIESEDARVERELRELREAEKKAALEREARERLEQEEARKRALERSKEDEALMKEWMVEAEKEAAAIGGVGADELQWNGLE